MESSHDHLRKWFENQTSQEMEIFKKHNFGNTDSLLKTEINWWLIMSLVNKWDPIGRVFRFGPINLCPTIEEYSRLLGIHYNTDAIVTPPLNQGFKSRMSKTLGVKRSIIEQKGNANECTMKFLCDLFAGQDAYEKNSSAFWVTHEDWKRNRVLAIELAILGHILFPKNLTGVDVRLLQFREQIEQGHTFVPALLADTIRALCMVKANVATHLECCGYLLQVWFLEHLVACRPLVTKGLFQEDLIKAHLKRVSWDHFKNREDWDSYLENLRPEQLCWKPSWLHVGEAIIGDLDGKPLLLLGFRGVKEYFPIRAIRQFGWSETTQLLVECIDPPAKIIVVEQQQAIKSWTRRRRVREYQLHELTKVLYPAHQNIKRRRESEEPTRPVPENDATHQIECLKREVEEQMTLIENLKGEAATRTQIYNEAVTEIQKKDQIISEYRDKIERCKHALGMMQRAGTSPIVVVEVIQDLINN